MRNVIGFVVLVSLAACGKDSGNGGNADSGATQDLAVPSGADLAGADLKTNGSDMAGMPSGAWLHTTGNAILYADGSKFQARGANLQDTRQCERCTYTAPSVSEMKHRIDALVDDWHANFIRLTLQSAADDGGFRQQWKTVLDDPEYLADIVEIVDYISSKNAYVLVSIWNDPSLDALGWPTAQTRMELEALVGALGDKPHVLFGVSNEPQSNFDGMLDDEVWDAMNAAVQAIRDKETELGVPHHVVSVQGTQAWARVLTYYIAHPIAAGGGANVAYETHVYDPEAEFAARFETPAVTLPVIIGEFGPTGNFGGAEMTDDDCKALMKRAEAISVPWLAWTFHHACPPNLIQEIGDASDQCGGLPGGMEVKPTAWGQIIKDRLAKAYNAP